MMSDTEFEKMVNQKLCTWFNARHRSEEVKMIWEVGELGHMNFTTQKYTKYSLFTRSLDAVRELVESRLDNDHLYTYHLALTDIGYGFIPSDSTRHETFLFGLATAERIDAKVRAITLLEVLGLLPSSNKTPVDSRLN